MIKEFICGRNSGLWKNLLLLYFFTYGFYAEAEISGKFSFFNSTSITEASGAKGWFATRQDEYFKIEKGIPHLPVFSDATKITNPVLGMMVYILSEAKPVVYDGVGWTDLCELVISSTTANDYFVVKNGIPYLPSVTGTMTPSVPGTICYSVDEQSIIVSDGSNWVKMREMSSSTLPVSDVFESGKRVKTCKFPILTDDPSNASVGAIYINNQDKSLRYYNGTIWLNVDCAPYVITNEFDISQIDSVCNGFEPPLSDDALVVPSALSGGQILYNGGKNVEMRGVIWSIKGDPFLEKNPRKTDDGSGIGKFVSTLDLLLGDSEYYVRAYAINSVGISYGNLVKIVTPAPMVPVLGKTQTFITDITDNSAVGQLKILSNGGAFVTECGVCVSEDELNYTYFPAPMSGSSDIGLFISQIQGLKSGTTYSYKAYAINRVGTAYSSKSSFRTASLAEISTTTPSLISGVSAKSGGNIKTTGDTRILSLGICWSATNDPLPDRSLSTCVSGVINENDGLGEYFCEFGPLSPNTTYYVRAYVENIAGANYGDLVSLTTPDYPQIITNTITSRHGSQVISGGQITNDGRSPVTARGICWGISINPMVSPYHTSDGVGVGPFTSTMTGLVANTTYHYRAYAKNVLGYAYGPDSTFTVTGEAPKLETLAATAVANMSALSGGKILSDGAAPILERGILWSSQLDPDSDLNPFSTSNFESNDGQNFTANLYGLYGATKYYVRAYARNKFGTGSGDWVEFVTSAAALPILSQSAVSITNITKSTALGKMFILNNGGGTLLSRGICLSTDQSTYSYYEAENTNIGENGTFTVLLTNLTPGTTYFAKGYASNSNGTITSSTETQFKTIGDVLLSTTKPNKITGISAECGGSITNTGNSIIKNRGIQWGTHQNILVKQPIPFVPQPFPYVESGIGSFSYPLTGLTPGTKYDVQAYAENEAGIYYGVVESFTTYLPPTLTTDPPSEVLSSSAISGGEIISDGGDPVSRRGICWGLYANPTLELNEGYVSDMSNLPVFSCTLSNLKGNTTYFVRAYAENQGGIAYGDQRSLTTIAPCIPSVNTISVNDIKGLTATVVGDIPDHGGSDVTERGFCWSSDSSPDVNDGKVECGTGNGEFSGELTNLTYGKKYYVRAYALNHAGLSYGEELSFTTKSLALLTTEIVNTSITSNSAEGEGHISTDSGSLVFEYGFCWNTSGTPQLDKDSYVSYVPNGGTHGGSFKLKMDKLNSNTKYYVRAWAKNDAGTAYGNEVIFTSGPATLATISTVPPKSGLNGITGISGGTNLQDGGSEIQKAGVLWSPNSGSSLNTSGIKKTEQQVSGDFASELTDLIADATFYVRAYVVTGAGTSYGDELSFNTFSIPDVVTDASVSNITSYSARLGGQINSDGGSPVEEMGFCWSLNPNPEISKDYYKSFEVVSSVFSDIINGLYGDSIYYVRAYAKNKVGIAYGGEIVFKALPPTLGNIITNSISVTSTTSADAIGTITHNGGAAVSTRGFVWSTVSGFDPDQVITERTAKTEYCLGNFTDPILGLEPNKDYYVRAYIKNSIGTAYGEEKNCKTPSKPSLQTYAFATGSNTAKGEWSILSDGGSPITAMGMVWSDNLDFNPDLPGVNKCTVGSGVFSCEITGLKANTTYYFRAYATNKAGTSFGNQVGITTDQPKLALLMTIPPYSISGTVATSGGMITDNGGALPITYGLIWGTDAFGDRPDTVKNRTVQLGTDISEFTEKLTGLKMGKKYYIRAYVVNQVGTAYGNELNFTTTNIPLVKTQDVVLSASGTSALGGGSILDNGGVPIADQGVCWSTSINPDVNLETKTTGDRVIDNSFQSAIDKILPVTTYYVRAYARNNQGTGYGSQVSFTTPVFLPKVVTSYVTVKSKTSFNAGGEVLDAGGGPISDRGLVWSETRNFDPEGVPVSNRKSLGVGAASFGYTVMGMNSYATYYVRAYATNSVGRVYGHQIEITIFPTAPVLLTKNITRQNGNIAMSGGENIKDGGDSITVKGVCWDTKENPVIDNNLRRTYNGSDIADFTSKFGGLSPKTLYWVRAYAVNGIGVGYGNQKSFLTGDLALLMATKYSNVLATTVKGLGEITNDGMTPVLSRGFCWSTAQKPTVLSPHTEEQIDTTQSNGVGTFFANIRGLSPLTTYFIRSYATNSAGTSYGLQTSFTTAAVTLPIVFTVGIDPSEIDSTKTVYKGDVLNDGGMPVNERGIYYGLTDPPTNKVYFPTGGTGAYSGYLIGLLPGKNYYIQAFATNVKGTAYGAIESINTKSVRPIVDKVAFSDLTGKTVVAKASIVTDGGSPVTDQGFYWNTKNILDITSQTGGFISAGKGPQTFSSIITGLQSNETYYVWAYATNANGTRFSQSSASFKTPTIPSLTTTKTGSVTDISAILGGFITNNGGVKVDFCGVCYSEVGVPTIDDLHQTEAFAGLGTFSINIMNLKQGTKYNFRAYAINSAGIGYGNPESFTTNDIPMVSTLKATMITDKYVVSGGQITSLGGQPLKSWGLCWSKTRKQPTAEITYFPDSTCFFNTKDAIAQTNISGLKRATTYYIRAWAENNLGKAYGETETVKTLPMIPMVKDLALVANSGGDPSAKASVTDTGGDPISQIGFCWNLTGNPQIGNPADQVIIADLTQGFTDFTEIISGLPSSATYYIRAFATNSMGTGYSSEMGSKVCPTAFTVTHVAGFNGAPVNKQVIYHSVSSTLSGSAKCWLTQNLGDDQQASGWFWQFNRLQGYQYDVTAGTTPLYPWISWSSNIIENSGWGASFDPCIQLLGQGWRLPLASEWTVVDGAPQNWSSLKNANDSELKLHAAGYLDATTGKSLTGSGSIGAYWSSNQNGSSSTNLASYLSLSDGPIPNSSVSTIAKATALPVRCISDGLVKTKPWVSNVSVTSRPVTGSDIRSGSATVISDGGDEVTERGLIWNTTGIAPPNVGDKIQPDNQTGKGVFSQLIGTLDESLTYYVWAYAKNSIGTSYSPTRTSFVSCPQSFSVRHVAGVNGAPIDATITYHSVSSNISDVAGKAKCWLTQNLGAADQAGSATDANIAAYGWYWQFNQPQAYLHDGTTRTPNSWGSSSPANGNWTTSDPCIRLIGNGWRLPTSSEWTSADAPPQYWQNPTDAFNSELKLHTAGYLDNTTSPAGSFSTNSSRGTAGAYWSFDQFDGTQANVLSFSTSTSTSVVTKTLKTNALPVRCIRDVLTFLPPLVDNVSFKQTSMSSVDLSALVALDNGVPIIEYGFCWNKGLASGTPIIPDITNSNVEDFTALLQVGDRFTHTMTNLNEDVVYYVRAYAKNNKSQIAYSTNVTSFQICPETIEVNHLGKLIGASDDIRLTYNSVSSTLSGKASCWLTKNLGAAEQAVSATDVRDEASGWYWQFNRKQRFLFSGGSCSPGSFTTTNEDVRWVDNDPCQLILRGGWRLPTSAEWSSVATKSPGWNLTFGSELKLHAAGYLVSSKFNPATARGAMGAYWSSDHWSGNYSNAYALQMQSGSNSVCTAASSAKDYAMPLRCIRTEVKPMYPMVGLVTIPNSTITTTTAVATAEVIDDGGITLLERGFYWDTTTASPGSKQNNFIKEDTTIPSEGTFSVTLSSLSEGPVYYVWAYARNAQGIAYSSPYTSFRICPATFDVYHVKDLSGAVETKPVTYHSVNSNVSGTALCWLTQNLGADREAKGESDDQEAAGWYWQFNGSVAYKHDGTTRTPSAFNTVLAAAWSSANEPCKLLLGSDWRLPTSSEWSAADASPQNWDKASKVYGSELKLHMAGYLRDIDGELLTTDGTMSTRGSEGAYWSSTLASSVGNILSFNSSMSKMDTKSVSNALPVRCVRGAISVEAPKVSNVSIPGSTINNGVAIGTATVALDGGSEVVERGLCWSSSVTLPTIADNPTKVGDGIGTFSCNLGGLEEGKTYYVRAYAKNKNCTIVGYSPVVTKFMICPKTFRVAHLAGWKGTPENRNSEPGSVDKLPITYGSVSSDISGAPACWLTQNLGADIQAGSATDSREEAAGWYWQFNKLQGFKHDGTTRTPSVSWPTGAVSTVDWASANDPCVNLIGGGWRLPTRTEWINADGSPRNWSKWDEAYNSELKLHAAGYLRDTDGTMITRGNVGAYWSSTQDPPTSSSGAYLSLLSSTSNVTPGSKLLAMPVRCILTAATSVPLISNVEVKQDGTSAIFSATLINNCGLSLKQRGFCWSSTNSTPTVLNSNLMPHGGDIGLLTATLDNLQETPTYYVRAYAEYLNGTIGYSPVSSFRICPAQFEVYHVKGLNGAPMDKKVTYHSSSFSFTAPGYAVSGTAVCWLTQNLGADREANAPNDSSEDAAGWYWKFGDKQGFSHNGTALSPSDLWASSNSVGNDPCSLLLGGGWRNISYYDWAPAIASLPKRENSADTYNSVLKLHQAGLLSSSTGALSNRGIEGRYWSNYLGNSGPWNLKLLNNSCAMGMEGNDPRMGMSIRCIRAVVTESIPTVSNVTIPISLRGESSVVCEAAVANNGGSKVTERGFYWNTTGTQNPLIDTKQVAAIVGDGVGKYNCTISNLTSGLTTYYVYAYATNNKGTVYSSTNSFKICPAKFTVFHQAGVNGAPVDKVVTYHSVSSNLTGTTSCWITQNLGAGKEATAASDYDEEAGGWYWQFNQKQGYKHDGTTRTPSTWVSSNPSRAETWESSKDPCNLLLGVGWQMTTYNGWEWVDGTTKNQSSQWTKASQAFDSELKLHMSGSLLYDDGKLSDRGAAGNYSSNCARSYGSPNWVTLSLALTSSSSNVSSANHATGMSLRCLNTNFVVSKPIVGSVLVQNLSGASVDCEASVLSDGGAEILERGFCYNTTGSPTTDAMNGNQVISIGLGSNLGCGKFNGTITGLSVGQTYYIRAYAKNSKGTTYSPNIIKIP